MKASASRDDVAPSTRRTFKSSLGGRVVTTAPAARPVSHATPKPCKRSPLLRPKSCPRLFWRRAETSGSSFCSEPSTTRSSLHIAVFSQSFSTSTARARCCCGSSLSKDALQGCFWLCQLDLHAEQLLLRVAAVDSTTRAFKDP